MCGAKCLVRDFHESICRYLNFFQHQCYIHA